MFHQSCYNNTINRFPVWEELRDLYIDGNNLKIDKEFDIEARNKVEKYNSESVLVSFDADYLIYSNTLKAPFRIKLSMRKKKDRLVVRGDWIGYNEFSLVPPMRITSIDVNICPKNKLFNCYYEFSILSNRTLATVQLSSNSIWFRELEHPIENKLIQGEFDINLRWSTESHSIDRSRGYLNLLLSTNSH